MRSVVDNTLLPIRGTQKSSEDRSHAQSVYIPQNKMAESGTEMGGPGVHLGVPELHLDMPDLDESETEELGLRSR